MSNQCPKCRSTQIEGRHLGKKVCGITGTFVGVIGALAASGNSARTGATVGLIGGPVGSGVGAVLGAVIGGITGGAAGQAIGEMLDEEVLDRYGCLACGHTFNDGFVGEVQAEE